MSQEEHLMWMIMKKYETYCQAFISLAGQINYLEEVHGMDLHEAKDRMWALLEQMMQDKPDWA